MYDNLYVKCCVFQLSCGNYVFLSYRLVDNCCLATTPAVALAADKDAEAASISQQPLNSKLRKLLLDVQVQAKLDNFSYVHKFYCVGR